MNVSFKLSPPPDVVFASGTENELRIGASGVTFKGATISDAGNAYRALMAAMNRPVAAPVPASTGREPTAWKHTLPEGGTFADGKPHQLLDNWDEAFDEWTAHGGTLESLFAEVASVAARELDVEAERREFEAHATERGLTLARGRLGDGYYLADTNEAWKAWCKVAARSAAQGTQPESAPVSTEKAGDAPVGYVDPQSLRNFETGVSTHEWLWRGPADACLIPLFTKAAPSPNNSPVGASEKEFEPCKNALIRYGAQAIPKSCPRCGLSKTCPRDNSPVGGKDKA